VRIKLPGALAELSIRCFAYCTGASADEAEKQLQDYSSIGEFFVRRLKADARPIGEGVVAPVDALVVEAGRITDNKTLWVKGEHYDLTELLGSRDSSQHFMNGYYLVCYLAPGDYHRIHSPVEGVVVRRTHISGESWPVNAIGMRFVSQLFVRNERVVTVIRHHCGYAAVVKVGALNVSSIRTTYLDDCRESASEFDKTEIRQDLVVHEPIELHRGQEIGYFEMGSTVVLLISEQGFCANERWREGVLRVGQSVGGFKLDEQ
jgi:phosphatidylserine decarboxylase